MAKYRDRLQIIADILSVIKDGAKKTHVMYQANLSYTLLGRYLTEVLEAGLASIDNAEAAMVSAYEAVLDAEQAGANVSGLLVRLTVAG